MSKENQAEGQEAAAGDTVTRVNKRPRGVDFNTFIGAVMKGNKEGKTNAEVAAALKMQPNSFGVRLSNTRTAIQDGDIVLKIQGKEVTDPKAIEKILEKLTLVRSAGGGRPAVDKGSALGAAVESEFAEMLEGLDLGEDDAEDK